VPIAPAQPMIAVIDRDRLTAYGLALLLRDWGYQSVTGVSAQEIFGRTEAQGQPIAAIVADDRSEDGSTGEDEATALTALAHRSIPIIVLATAGEGGGEAGGINRIPKPIEPFRLRDLLRTVVTFAP
jgi:two-component system, sensor histidine kinase